MVDELLQEVETNDLVRYYTQLYNQQVALECERLWWNAILLFQIETATSSLITENIVS